MSGKFCCTTAMKCAITLLTLHSTWMLFVCCSYGRPSFIKEWPQLINSSFTNPLSLSPLLRGDGGGGIMIRDLHNLLHVISLMAGKWLCNMFVYCPFYLFVSMEDYSGLSHSYKNYSELPGIQCVILLFTWFHIKKNFSVRNEFKTNILYQGILYPADFTIIKSLYIIYYFKKLDID